MNDPQFSSHDGLIERSLAIQSARRAAFYEALDPNVDARFAELAFTIYWELSNRLAFGDRVDTEEGVHRMSRLIAHAVRSRYKLMEREG